MCPGPNDYHLVEDGVLEPGLGKDEPSDEQRLAMKSKGAERLLALKQELETQTAELSVKERELEARELEFKRKDAEMKAREEKLLKAEKKAGIAPPPATESVKGASGGGTGSISDL